MKNILLFNDISGLGNCSLAANLPIFTKLGHYCMPVVTATFSCQTGFEKFTCQPNTALPQCAKDIVKNRPADFCYVGFCANSQILQQVTAVVQGQKVPYFVDPILGDNGKLYPVFDEEYLAKMKLLVRGADCISPNLTEACLLADVDYFSVVSQSEQPGYLAICGQIFGDFLLKTGAKKAVITGIQFGKMVGNLVLEKSQIHYVTSDSTSVNYSGAGDAFSSVLLGEMLCGANLFTATQIAANFVYRAAKSTLCADRRFGLDISAALNLL